MAQIYTTGPVAIYVGVGANGAPVFLGHGSRGARVQIRRFFQPIHTDLSGPQMDHDKAFLGEMHSWSVQLQRWNEGVLRLIQDVPGARSAIPRRGTIFPGFLGALMVGEACAWPFWATFPYSNLPFFAQGGNAQDLGMHYFWAHLTDDSVETGITPKSVQINIATIPNFDPTAFANGIQGGWALYDTAVQGLPAFD